MEFDSETDASIDMMRDMTVYETSFVWAVDSAIRSSTPSISGSSPLPSFASVVDRAIRSRTPSNSGAFPVQSFASVVDRAIRSRTASNSGAFPVHSFASPVDMRTISTQLSQAVSNVTGNVHGFQLFTMPELAAATNNFSTVNKIGAGSFGVVYRGNLADGREVAIKRGKPSSYYESHFVSELVLSRLHHKHLIKLFGFYEEKDERILVFEYMENGMLRDHLDGKNNVNRGRSVFNQWKIRIKIALDASRGIEYLHNHAVPSIIHRNIKSFNILLDVSWTPKVSGFGLSLMSPVPDSELEDSLHGTIGYVDPEFYRGGVVTAKSDVYGLGVVLLELLTGKRAIFKSGEGRGTRASISRVVDYAVPRILRGELVKILDQRVGPPDVNEAEAVELLADTAIHCLKLKGEDRPTMTEVVLNLERALAICDTSSSSYDNISSVTISDLSESFIH